MAIKFTETKGSAKKSDNEYYKFKDGDNTFRLVGDICARYVYWVKNKEGNSMPLECLAFNRETETFDNAETDWVAHYYPEDKCQWAYVVQVIDPSDKKIKLMGLKKKMFQQILETAEQIGDPTDPDTGYYITVNRKKNGPLPFNVEYTVKQLMCKPTPLKDWEKELYAEIKPIDQLVSRQTADEQHETLKKYFLSDSNTDQEAVDDLS